MSTWIPLPFPKCPKCHQSWVKSYHSNCSTEAEILVEPHLRQVKCKGCCKQWRLMNSSFSCSCRYAFRASEVEIALSTSELLRQRLLQKIQEMNYFEQVIIRTSKKSFNSWIEKVSYEIGKILGTTIYNVQHLTKSIAEKILGI
jgi:hypothetical protein